MKKAISNFIKFTIFVSIVIVLLFKVGKIFVPEKIGKNFQGITYTVSGFYEMPKNSIDVAFIGDSNMLWAVSPMELWNEYGITSYNYSVSSAKTWTMYYFLKEVLKTQKPKVVVIDPVSVFYGCASSEELAHVSFDWMPLGINKMKMVNDEAFKFDFEDKLGMIMPIFRYHDRWQDVKASDFSKISNKYYSVTRGFAMHSAVKPIKQGYAYMEKENKKIDFVCNNDKYILKIKELCDTNNIKLLILGLEESVNWGKTQSEKIAEFAEKNSIDLYDLNQLRYLNWEEDSRDGFHVNIVGAMKTTEVIGKYLNENYELPNHKDEKKYEFWNDDYEIYSKWKKFYIADLNKRIEKLQKQAEMH